MAKEFSTQEIRELISALNDQGLGDLSDKIQAKLERGAKLARKELKTIAELQKAENKRYQEKLKQYKKYLDAEEELDEFHKQKMKALEEELKMMNKSGVTIDKINEKHRQSSTVINNARQAIERYTSVAGLFDAAVHGLVEIYDSWFTIQQTITRSMGELAQRTGASRVELIQFRTAADQMRDTFVRLGGSVDGWAESFQFVGDAALAMRSSITDLTEDFQMELLAAQRGLGMSADSAAQLVRTLETGIAGGNEELGDFILNLRAFSSEIGANSSQMAQDFLDSRDALQRFGQDGERVFQRTAQFANHLGFETRRILDMANQFNRFGQASEHMNQLNAMFGTTISSLELMQEEDPVRRIEMITGAIREQGISWQDMTFAQQDALAQSLGVSQSEAGRLMSGESMAQIQAEQAQRQQEQAVLAERQARAQETILSIIEESSTAFRSWRDYLQMIINEVGEILDPIFQSIHGSSEGIMIAIRDWVRRIGENPNFQRTIQNIANWIEELPEHIEEFMPTWDEIYKTAQDIWPYIRDMGEMLLEVIQFAVEHPTAIAVALGVAASLSLASNLANSLAAVTAISAAGPGMVAAFGGLAGALAPLAALGGAAALGELRESQRGEEGQAVASRDIGTLRRLQASAREELFSRRQSGTLDGSESYLTNLQQGLGIISGQEADQRMNNIESVIGDYIRPGTLDPQQATANLLSIIGPSMAQQIAERNGASSFDEFVRSRFMDDPYLREHFRMSLGLGPPEGLAQESPVEEAIATEAGSSVGSSATDTAPVTQTTVLAQRTASVGDVQIVAADVVLDGRSVGRAIFEVSRV